MSTKTVQARLRNWFSVHARDLPWRTNLDPYSVLVSELMLQQTQVTTVLPYYLRWMNRFPDFPALASAPEQEVLSLWQGLGYYSRARNLHRAAIRVCTEHGGRLPSDVEALRRLPGVGPYTAGAIASFAFNLPVPAVDANIARVLARLDNLLLPVDSGAGRRRLWELAGELLPAESPRIHNWALMELGALVCVPRKPRCGECPLRRSCRATDPGSLPLKQPRRKVVDIEEACVFRQEDGRVWMEREEGARWRGLWRLPRIVEVPPSRPVLVEPYGFTHHRVSLSVYTDSGVVLGPRAVAVEVGKLCELPLAAADARVVRRLLLGEGSAGANPGGVKGGRFRP